MPLCSKNWPLLVMLLLVGQLPAQDKTTAPKGLRVFSCGHSFHYFMPVILNDMAHIAEIKDHKQVGVSAMGGSRVYQHWNVADDKNKAKEALKAGAVDVLTLSPIYLPDDGIEKFAKLAIEGNPKIRVFVQEFWLPFDMYEPTFTKRPKEVDHDAFTIEDLRKMHEPYFKSMDEHVVELNKKLDTKAIHVSPVGQAVLALRAKILEGKAPGLKKQSDLFIDPIGHARPQLQALNAYVHYAVLYGKSPVGLPMPIILKRAMAEESLNRLLQEIAWEAALNHPLSGVQTK